MTLEPLVARGVSAVLQPLLPGGGAGTHGKLVMSSVAVVAVIAIRHGVLALVHRRVVDPTARYRWAKTSSYVAFATAALVVTQVWFTAMRSVGTFLGLLSAGIAIALKDVIANLAGWLFLLWRRPFDVGDRIQIGGHAGDVVDIRLFAFSLLEIGNWVDADQSTGRVIHVPNATVFTQPQANYTSGFSFIWNEVHVTLTLASDWRKAKALLEEIADRTGGAVTEAAERSLNEGKRGFLIHYQKLTPAVYTSVVDSGVRLTLRYLTRPRERRGTAQALWEHILTAFSDEADIVFAHPTQRVVLQHAECGAGKAVSNTEGALR